MTYEELMINYADEIDIYEHPLRENPIIKKKNGKGIYYNNDNKGLIFIEDSLSNTDKKCTLAEEIGHHYTSYGNILDISNYTNAKQERKAREWGANMLINYERFKKTIKIYDNLYQVAEELDVTYDVLITYISILEKNEIFYKSCML